MHVILWQLLELQMIDYTYLQKNQEDDTEQESQI